MKMPQFKFVTVGNGDGKTSKLTGSIRGHAIRAGLQKTTASNRNRRRAQGPRSTRTKEELMFRFGPYGEMKPSQERSACGVESLGASKVDPLDSLPIPMNTEVDCLIKYCEFYNRTAHRRLCSNAPPSYSQTLSSSVLTYLRPTATGHGFPTHCKVHQ